MVKFSGVMPANLLPFTADLAIDEPAYRKHLRWLADTRGVTGVVANGHAAEVSSLSREERRRALAIALDEVGPQCPVVAGVYADGTQEAVELARDAKAEGARRINDRLDPLVQVFYAPPFVDMHNRMKAALVLLGRLPAAHVRPPLTPVSAAEREAIRQALAAARLAPARPSP